MDLPEAVGGQPPVAPDGVLGDLGAALDRSRPSTSRVGPGRRTANSSRVRCPGAVDDRRCVRRGRSGSRRSAAARSRASGAGADPARRRRRPGSASGSASAVRPRLPPVATASTSPSQSMSASRCSCSASTDGLEPALPGEADVLEVAATAAPRTGRGTRRLHPVRAGSRTSTRRPARSLSWRGVGDARSAPAPPAARAGRRPPARRAGPRSARRERPVRPRPRSGTIRASSSRAQVGPPAAGPRSSRASRSSALPEDCSRYGTEVTITPGVNSSRAFSRSALWLCRICSHQ